MIALEGKAQRQIDNAFASLGQEFQGRLPDQTVRQVGSDVLASLLNQARFPDFVPVLTLRYARERLLETAAHPQGG